MSLDPAELARARAALSTNGGAGIRRHIFLCAEQSEPKCCDYEAGKLASAIDPREKFVVVSFDQDYRSSNLSNTMRKRQYWQREGGTWRIIHEGAA